MVTLDNVVQHMETKDRPALSRKPREPISVEEAALIARQASYQPVDVPLSPLDAAMAGLRFDYVKRNGEKVTVNPKSKRVATKMKNSDSLESSLPNQEQLDTLLGNILKAVLTNEGSFSALTVWDYCKQHPTPLSYSVVTAWADKKLEHLCNTDKAIRCVNNLEVFKVYAK